MILVYKCKHTKVKSNGEIIASTLSLRDGYDDITTIHDAAEILSTLGKLRLADEDLKDTRFYGSDSNGTLRIYLGELPRSITWEFFCVTSKDEIAYYVVIQCMDTALTKKDKQIKKSEPDNRTIGFELEVTGLDSRYQLGNGISHNATLDEIFEVGSDGSITAMGHCSENEGYECECPDCGHSHWVEPDEDDDTTSETAEIRGKGGEPLSVFLKEDGKVIRDLIEVINDHGDENDGPESSAEYECGLHIHVQVSAEEKVWVAQYAIEHQDEVFDMYPPDSNRSGYCEKYNRGGERLTTNWVLNQAGRYVWLNIREAWTEGRKTVEFRLFDGTLDPDEIIERLKWCHEFICAAIREGRERREAYQNRVNSTTTQPVEGIFNYGMTAVDEAFNPALPREAYPAIHRYRIEEYDDVDGFVIKYDDWLQNTTIQNMLNQGENVRSLDNNKVYFSAETGGARLSFNSVNNSTQYIRTLNIEDEKFLIVSYPDELTKNIYGVRVLYLAQSPADGESWWVRKEEILKNITLDAFRATLPSDAEQPRISSSDIRIYRENSFNGRDRINIQSTRVFYTTDTDFVYAEPYTQQVSIFEDTTPITLPYNLLRIFKATQNNADNVQITIDDSSVQEYFTTETTKEYLQRHDDNGCNVMPILTDNRIGFTVVNGQTISGDSTTLAYINGQLYAIAEMQNVEKTNDNPDPIPYGDINLVPGVDFVLQIYRAYPDSGLFSKECSLGSRTGTVHSETFLSILNNTENCTFKTTIGKDNYFAYDGISQNLNPLRTMMLQINNDFLIVVQVPLIDGKAMEIFRAQDYTEVLTVFDVTRDDWSLLSNKRKEFTSLEQFKDNYIRNVNRDAVFYNANNYNLYIKDEDGDLYKFQGTNGDYSRIYCYSNDPTRYPEYLVCAKRTLLPIVEW